MQLRKSAAYRFIRDRLGPRGRHWAEVGRAAFGLVRCGWAGFDRECNICSYSGRFYPHGIPHGLALNLDVGCPSCVSMPRHRLLKLWFDQNQLEITGRSVLHFAPERSIRGFIEAPSSSYVAADLDPENPGDRVLDIEKLDLPNASFDVAICSHILEHVDDKAALSELHLVIAPGGLLLVMVPLVDSWQQTYEPPGIVSPQDRLLHFGQRDHVRYYGGDIRQRLSQAGFSVSEFVAQEPYVGRHGLARGETLFVCRRS